MRVAAMAAQQQGIADVVQRRGVLPRRQRAVGGSGGLLKTHEILSARQKRTFARQRPIRWPRPPLPKTCKCLKNYPKPREIPDVTDITVNPRKSPHSGSRNATRGA